MIQRFFRAHESVYEAVLSHINSEWGLPANGQKTAFASVVDAPRDAVGRCYLAVWDFFCEYEAVASMLPALLENGQVEEIDAATYGSLGGEP